MNQITFARFTQTSRWLCMLVLAIVLSACVRSEDGLDNGANPPVGSSSTPGDTTPTPGDTTPPPVDPDPPIDPPSVTDQTLFAQTLHPLLRDPANFCVTCHGANQIPTFAIADATAAYNVIISQQKVDLNNPALSRIYLRPAEDRHNCGGDAICDRVAADFLAAIQDWAQQAAATVPPPTGSGQAVMSAATNLAAGLDTGAARVDANAVAMFAFTEGAGNVTMDTSNVGTPITLQIEGMEWVEGGLRNVSGKAQASVADSVKLFDAITASGEYSVEAWVIPDNNSQDGPARMVSYSQDTALRNFTLGQNAIYYQLRNQSAGTSANGTPALEALNQQVDTSLQHVVVTFDPASGRKVYVNGQLDVEENTPDTLAWQNDQIFVIGNEVTNDRLWQGVFRLVAVHDKALNGAEIQQNFDAGAGNLLTLSFDVAAVVGAPARIEMQVAPIDGESYLFAKPVFISDATGVAVKNIRIAVNDNVPVAAQVFRRVDTTVLQSGVELSPLGAVIPAELGPDNDQFHLEFEVLGDQAGLAEPIAPAAPPTPVADATEPDVGVRTFSQVNDTMANLTGIDPGGAAVRDRYNELRDSLPATSDLLAFAAAQQVAIQRLATTYCGEIVNNAGSCANFFGSCTIDVNGKGQVADALFDSLIGDNIANQPDRAGVSTEIVRMLDDLGCVNGCSGATAETALQASCAAVLSSGAVTIN